MFFARAISTESMRRPESSGFGSTTSD